MRRFFAWLWVVPVPLALALDVLTGAGWPLSTASCLAAATAMPVLIRVQRSPDRTSELLLATFGQLLALGVVALVPTMSTTTLWLSLVVIVMLTRLASGRLDILAIVILAATTIACPLLMPDGLTFGFAATTVVVAAVAIGVMLRSMDRSLLERQATAAEAERRRIATDLHDLIAHEVTGIVVLAQAASRSDNSPLTATVLQKIEDSGSRALTEIRHIVSDTRTESATRVPVASGSQALRDRVTAFGDRATIDIVDLADSATDIDERVWPVLDRVLVESLTNVRRHAGPDAAVSVRLERCDSQPETLTMTVTNCPGSGGIGAGSGTGLSSLRTRVSRLGGSTDVGPDLKGGWSVRTCLPAAVQPAAPACDQSEKER
ncbi:sensor histidine kinase [Brevibacterium aurantiacum]|uniref:histidine kinase n=1 Tax=Brevibacterium aurantiacum TaxID=273384 RepID=A0A556C6P6_BREAU|nr:histidine kinase [Brevibacterium aurantiacum]TSI12678.1 hypothetical protein FO013_19605 [Brevibacterium aurantiacum]